MILERAVAFVALLPPLVAASPLNASELCGIALAAVLLFFLARDHRSEPTCLPESSSSFSNTSKASSAIRESVKSEGNVGRLGLTSPTPRYGSLHT
ncbi:hypothetical protein MRX96_018703 [Rhipicephalus microplus]